MEKARRPIESGSSNTAVQNSAADVNANSPPVMNANTGQ